MEIGPTKRIVRRVAIEGLRRHRLYGHLTERRFADKVSDLPDLLRELAGQLEDPSPDLTQLEPPAFEGYSRWADEYDNIEHNPVIAGEETVIRDLFGDVKNKLVLDAGCGTGRHAIPLAEMGAKVVGFEPTEAMLDIARQKAEERHLDIDFRPGALEGIVDDENRYDLVLCCLVLSHVENLIEAISILAGHVRQGGSLIISDFHPFNILIGMRTSFSSAGRKYVGSL
jgi:2-polyprenyl-3-methyl-5-hydroxy-6-metoxy-1,4-benzoquinol methylase